MVWAVFGQTIHYEFTNYDDPTYVYQSPAFNQGLSWHGIVWVFTHEYEHEWFPVTYVSRMLDFQIYGANAGGHHLTNVLLHAATAILLFLVLGKMTGTFWRAAFVAAVFAIHPLRVESVAWVVERKDVLSGLFFMLTLGAWRRYTQKRAGVENRERDQAKADSTSPRRWIPDYVLALAFFTLGLLSKSMLVTLPFVLLLLDYWPLKRLPSGGLSGVRREFPAWWGLILEKVPFLVLSAGACLTTVLTEKNIVLAAKNSTFFWRIGRALLAYADYLGHMVYPVGLAVVYPCPDTNPSLTSVGWSALILLIISGGVIAGARKHPYLLVGWLWYLGMFLPIIDSMQLTQNARADRYTYLPQIGLYILATWGAAELLRSWRHRRAVLGSVAAAILASLLVIAHIQTHYWKDSVSLWTHTLACTSENSFAENSLGSALANRGKWEEAIPHFERALQIKPDYVGAHINLGILLNNHGKPEAAIQHFTRALQLNPSSAEANYHLGDALADQANPAEATRYLERALQLKPDYAEAHYDMGLILARQGKWDEAIQHFQPALQLKLGHTDAQYILAVSLAAHKKWDEAIVLYRQVLQLKPDFAEAHYNLGVALAGQEKSSEAVQQFQQALTLARAQGNATLAESIRARLNAPAASVQP